MTTFKFFGPSGDCRRVTFNEVPGLESINEVANELVCFPVDNRVFYYVDSEGDRVVIKSSHDVKEVVQDARQAGAQTVKIHIRRHPGRRGTGGKSPECRSSDKQTGSRPSACGASHRKYCYPGAHVLRGGILGFPVWDSPQARRVEVDFSGIDDFLEDTLGAFFPNIFCETAKCSSSPSQKPGSSDSKQDPAAAANAKQSTERGGQDAEAAEINGEARRVSSSEGTPAVSTDESPDVADETPAVSTDESPAVADETKVEVPHTETTSIKSDSEQSRIHQEDGRDPQSQQLAEDYEVVEVKEVEVNTPDSNDVGAAGKHESITDTEISAKVSLLRDMGFSLPSGVARNMIREMGGRMDLIVRALVANNQ